MTHIEHNERYGENNFQKSVTTYNIASYIPESQQQY